MSTQWFPVVGRRQIAADYAELNVATMSQHADAT